MNNKAVDQQIIRETNQYLMLDLIQKNKSVTRAFLSGKLNLSPPSVSSNIEKLIHKEVLIEKGIDKSGKEKLGRKGILIEFNRNFVYMLSVDLSSTQLKIAISNIYEEIIGNETLDIIEDDYATSIYKKIISSINNALKKYGIKKETLGLIIVGSPGVINEDTGEMKYIPQFTGWEDINIKERLEEFYKVKVLVRNDINLITIGEAKYGIGKDVNDFLHINVELGVGAGLILNRKLYSGSHFASGEVGYMVTCVQELGKVKQQGSLESLIAIPQIKKNIAKALGKKKEEITIEKINQLYKENNEVVLSEIERVAQVLSAAIINISALLDLQLIVLGGTITRLDVELIERIQVYVSNMLPFVPDIKFSQLENSDCAKGAFSIGAEQILKELVEK